jgi:hypothetical protein
MDIFANELQKGGMRAIKEDNIFQQVYFRKIFHEQLSLEYQETLSLEEKL